MNRDNTGKYNTDSMGHTYGYDYKGGQDLENTGRAQTTVTVVIFLVVINGKKL